VGDVPWSPDLDMHGVNRLDDRVKELLARCRLPSAPVVVELGGAGVVGIVGNRDGALALARSLVVQAAVHCGPADLTIGIFCDDGREPEWEWAGWLPHSRRACGDGVRWASNQRDTGNSMLRALLDGIDGLPTSTMLIVIDSETLTEGRDSPARELLGFGRTDSSALGSAQAEARKVSGIVIAETSDQLPASCTVVIEVGQDAACMVQHDAGIDRVEDVILAGIHLGEAEDCARRLARFEDPELVIPGASLPSLVRLPELLASRTLTSDAIRELWASTPGVSTPVGLGENGTLNLDIVRDGPHGLVGGTTGSGKSEFLRSFVAGLAAHNSPEDLNFVLIDFKGGAAFKTCERLPHTIGTISNLDEQLADRALRALEAEMERRQRLFAAAGEGIDNLPAYLATNPPEPLPRLLLVIDEFAMLAKEFPDVLASLVSVGAVGRTLGVHMILATQRPAGVVNDDILANTNMRVALRVQSREDSSNVIGVPSAASIGREQMGRAYVKLGQDDIAPVQTALVTGRAQADGVERIDIRQVGLFGAPVPPRSSSGASSDVNDLDLLIDAVISANDAAGIAPPRQIWPRALGERIDLDDYECRATGDAAGEPRPPRVGGMEGEVIRVALADEPDLQRQSPAGWNLAEGNLLLLGVPGSGTSTTLASLALSVAGGRSPAELDILCLDMGSRDLAPLAQLPHTVAYVGAGAGAKEQQARFLRHLEAELRRRQESHAPGRKTLILIDGLAALRDEMQGHEHAALLEAFYRVYADGPSLGLHFAVSTTRATVVPGAIDEVTTQRWIFRLADQHDYALFGIKGKDLPAQVAGRCVDPARRLQMQVATPARGLPAAAAEAAARWAHVPEKESVIGALPQIVSASCVAESTDLSGEPMRIAVGLREDTLEAAVLEIYEGEGVLIVGPARSGKSALLLGIAETLRKLSGPRRPLIWIICDRRSPLMALEADRAARKADEIPALLSQVREEGRQVFLLIDDAERVEDQEQRLTKVIEAGPSNLCIIAAGRSSDLREGAYGHWSKPLRKSRCGVILQPDVVYDGEFLNVTLPRQAPVALTTGRGYVCSGGEIALVQTMTASDRTDMPPP